MYSNVASQEMCYFANVASHETCYFVNVTSPEMCYFVNVASQEMCYCVQQCGVTWKANMGSLEMCYCSVILLYFVYVIMYKSYTKCRGFPTSTDTVDYSLLIQKEKKSHL